MKFKDARRWRVIFSCWCSSDRFARLQGIDASPRAFEKFRLDPTDLLDKDREVTIENTKFWGGSAEREEVLKMIKTHCMKFRN